MTLWRPTYELEDPQEEGTCSRTHGSLGPEPSKNISVPWWWGFPRCCDGLLNPMRPMTPAKPPAPGRGPPAVSENGLFNPPGRGPASAAFTGDHAPFDPPLPSRASPLSGLWGDQPLELGLASRKYLLFPHVSGEETETQRGEAPPLEVTATQDLNEDLEWVEKLLCVFGLLLSTTSCCLFYFNGGRGGKVPSRVRSTDGHPSCLSLCFFAACPHLGREANHLRWQSFLFNCP